MNKHSVKNIRTSMIAKASLFIGLFFLIAAIFMLIWNAILPEVLTVKTINYWQSMGIIILSKILFGNAPVGRRGRGVPPFSKNNRRDMFMKMSAEEKMKMKEAWKDRCAQRGNK